MSGLKKIFDVSTSAKIKDMGEKNPPWLDNYEKSNWALDGQDYYYWLPGDKAYIQYGENAQLWASARFYGQSLSVDTEDTQDDNSIKVKGKVTLMFLVGRNTDYVANGVDVRRTIKLNGKVINEFNGRTNEEYTNDIEEVVEFSETIKPGDKSKNTQLEIATVYPNGEFENSTIRVGISLKNTNPSIYTPGAIRKNGKWEELHRVSSSASDSDNHSSNDTDNGSSDTSSDNQDNNSSDKGNKQRDADPIMLEILQWAIDNVGKAYDFDKRYGAQCVDEVTYLNNAWNLGLTPVLVGRTAYDIYMNNHTNMPKGWADMQTNHNDFNMKDQREVWAQIPDGAFVWFKHTDGAPGHVGIKGSDKFGDLYSQNYRGDGTGYPITRDDLSTFIEQGNRILGAWYKPV